MVCRCARNKLICTKSYCPWLEILNIPQGVQRYTWLIIRITIQCPQYDTCRDTIHILREGDSSKCTKNQSDDLFVKSQEYKTYIVKWGLILSKTTKWNIKIFQIHTKLISNTRVSFRVIIPITSCIQSLVYMYVIKANKTIKTDLNRTWGSLLLWKLICRHNFTHA